MITRELATEIDQLLRRMNRGYWEELSWELLSDGAEIFFLVTLDEGQNNRTNIYSICAILRTVLGTLLPSSSQGLTWVGSVTFQGKAVGSVCGGLGEDWRTLGTHGGLDEDYPVKE